MTDDKLNRCDICIVKFWIYASESFDNYFFFTNHWHFQSFTKVVSGYVLGSWKLPEIWAVAVFNETLFLLSERLFDELNWLLLITRLVPGLEKVHIAMLCLPWHFRHECFSEHLFANCSYFKHTKQSPFCLINFLCAKVSETKRHLFDKCFEPKNTHDVVLLLFTKDLRFEYDLV